MFTKNKIMENFKNHILISDHSENCATNLKFKNCLFYGRTIENNLIYFNGDFYLISYCSCLRGYNSKPEFVQNILNRNFKESKNIFEFIIERNEFDKHTRRLIKEDKLFSDFTNEVNFIYYSASKRYYIYSKIKFIEHKLYNKVDDNYKNMYDYLLSNDYSELIKELDNLHAYNTISGFDVSKTTFNELSNELNKKIKNRLKS